MIYVDHPTLGSKEFILRGIRIAGVNRAIESGRVTHPTLGDLQFWDGTLAALTVSASPTYVQGAVAASGFATITTASTTASVDGGSPPYAYAWSVFDAGGGSWTPTAPSLATTAFQAVAVDSHEQFTGTMRCTVTDSRGATGTVDVTAFVRNYGPL